jgi:serine/threonine protein kinase
MMTTVKLAALPNGTTLTQLRIDRLLVSSPLGFVYEGFRQGQPCLVKELGPEGLVERQAGQQLQALPGQERRFSELQQRAWQEWQRLGSLLHPSVQKPLAYWAEHATIYASFALAEGRSLEERLVRDGFLPASEIGALLSLLLPGLGELHQRGLVHGNIAPEHLILGIIPQLHEYGGFWLGSSVAASPYSAPETSKGQLLPQSDLYALAACAYHALSGQPPVAAIARQNGAFLTPLQVLRPQIPERLASVIEQALALDPAKRPASAEIMAQQLRANPSLAGRFIDLALPFFNWMLKPLHFTVERQWFWPMLPLLLVLLAGAIAFIAWDVQVVLWFVGWVFCPCNE